jgi:hypothetical protein
MYKIMIYYLLISMCLEVRVILQLKKAMFKLLNNILHALNNKAYVGGIFCDLEKAFDCVNHDLLMNKLKLYGIVGNAYDLIQ